MHISLSLITSTVALMACNNLPLNAGSYDDSLSKDSERMVINLRVKPIRKGVYTLEETYNSGSIRESYVVTNSNVKKNKKNFLGIKEIVTDDNDGSETKTFFNPLYIDNPDHIISGNTQHRNGKISYFNLGMPFGDFPLNSLKGHISIENNASKQEASALRIRKERLKLTDSNIENKDEKGPRPLGSSLVPAVTSRVIDGSGALNAHNRLRTWKRVPPIEGLKELTIARQVYLKRCLENSLDEEFIDSLLFVIRFRAQMGLNNYVIPYYQEIKIGSPKPVRLRY